MSDSPTAATTRSVPGFFGALCGIWLLTWRSQLTLRRLPGQLGMLLVLPILIYMTVASPDAWARRNVSLGDPFRELNTFARRLKKEKIPFQPKTREALGGILAQENQK